MKLTTYLITTVLGLDGALSWSPLPIDRISYASHRKNYQRGIVTKASESGDCNWALLFDCDGVIVETEELHRLAYNGAFDSFGLEVDGEAVVWEVSYYDKLQNTVGGGKPKMKWHFTNTMAGKWPVCTKGDYGAGLLAPNNDPDAQSALVDALQDAKTEIYKGIVESAAEARPGVLELMDEAIATPGVAVGICSAATRAGFEKVVNSVVGKDRLDKLDIIIAGDDVSNKKPDPEIYDTARARLETMFGTSLPASRCLVIEDSMVGLRAAKGANMRCLITYTASTADQDFYAEGADAKVLDLSQRGGVTVADLFGADLATDPASPLLSDKRDPMVDNEVDDDPDQLSRLFKVLVAL